MGLCPVSEAGARSGLRSNTRSIPWGYWVWGGQLVSERFEVRETEYGYGIWDARAGDWWIRRLDMTQRDAEQIVAELQRGEAEL